MWTKELLEKINKDDLINECNLDCNKNKSKDVVVNLAYSKIQEDQLLAHKINKNYGDRIALHPTKVEEILSITKTERKRWEDKFKIRYYDTFSKYGKSFEYPMYDYFSIMSISKEMIEEWRVEHKKQVSENRKIGVEKAKETKKENEKRVKSFYEDEWLTMVENWKSTDLELANTYKLAFWTMWLSRTAKLFQEKASRSKIHKLKYLEKKEQFYKLKNEAIELLVKSKYTNISFYRPEDPDKIRVQFCHLHYDTWCMLRQGCYMDKWDYYFFNKKEINKCEDCITDIQKDYYSLYYIEINSDKIPEYKFSFHTPYPLEKDVFGDPNQYKQVEHEENLEGLFRFGRSLDDGEAVIFTEKRTLKYFNECKEDFINFYKRKELISIVSE